ncbi:MAG: hypothetical protein RIB98_15125 [Acidimicrobiales bacterium]
MSTPHAAVRLLEELVAERIDPLVSKTEVYDRLLDLRNLVTELPSITAIVDDRLRAVPGATLVPGAWWHEELRSLRMLLDAAFIPESAAQITDSITPYDRPLEGAPTS